MPELVFAMTAGLVWCTIRQLIREAIRKIRARKPEPICANCFYAHMQYGAKAQRTISCTFGGLVRPMKLDVLYCTHYRGREDVRNVRIGFVYEIVPAE